LEIADPEIRLCSNCQNEIVADSNFCRTCGQAQNLEEVKFYSNKRKNLIQVALFFAIELVFCISAALIEDYTINVALFFDVTMAVCA